MRRPDDPIFAMARHIVHTHDQQVRDLEDAAQQMAAMQQQAADISRTLDDALGPDGWSNITMPAAVQTLAGKYDELQQDMLKFNEQLDGATAIPQGAAGMRLAWLVRSHNAMAKRLAEVEAKQTGT